MRARPTSGCTCSSTTAATTRGGSNAPPGEVDQLREHIAQEQRQVESFTVLLRRRARAELQRENRRAQSLQDELATNSVMRLARRDGGDD